MPHPPRVPVHSLAIGDRFRFSLVGDLYERAAGPDDSTWIRPLIGRPARIERISFADCPIIPASPASPAGPGGGP